MLIGVNYNCRSATTILAGPGQGRRSPALARVRHSGAALLAPSEHHHHRHRPTRKAHAASSVEGLRASTPPAAFLVREEKRVHPVVPQCVLDQRRAAGSIPRGFEQGGGPQPGAEVAIVSERRSGQLPGPAWVSFVRGQLGPGERA